MTKAQERVYGAVVGWFRTHQSSPSLEDVREATGLASVSTVHGHVEALIRAGYLAKTKHTGRGLRVVERDATCPTCGQTWNGKAARRA